MLGISFGELREAVDSVEVGDGFVYRILARAKRVAADEYLLSNGVHIKLRPVLTWVGKTDSFSSDGSPIYSVNPQIVPQIKLLPRHTEKKGKIDGKRKEHHCLARH